MGEIKIVECYDLPENPNLETVYRLLPQNPDNAYYYERTDRNIGWITREEQDILRRSVVGVAGCGGMGAQLAEKFLRLGIGEIRIADNEVFDVSNINRQFAAGRTTVGKSKAFSTARLLRDISDDALLVVYPQGIAPESVDSFVGGSSVICDEIEFMAVGARVLLHERSRRHQAAVFCSDTIGFGTHLFLFTPSSATMEECLGLSYQEAAALEKKIREGCAAPEEKLRVIESVFRGLFPEFPNYLSSDVSEDNPTVVRRRLFKEGKGSIIASNPPFAAGLLTDRVLLYLLRNSGVKRSIVDVPEMPGYLYFDAAKVEAKAVRGRWW